MLASSKYVKGRERGKGRERDTIKEGLKRYIETDNKPSEYRTSYPTRTPSLTVGNNMLVSSRYVKVEEITKLA